MKKAVIAITALATAGAIVFAFHRNQPLLRLARAIPKNGRLIDARLTGGFQWAPRHRVTRSGNAMIVSSDRLRLNRVAAEIIAEHNSDPSPKARHALAVALLLHKQDHQATTVLAQLAAETPTDARLWNDLAAARYEVAVREADPSLLAAALVAADRSLSLDRSLPEGLFNRALIIEHLGLRDQAREAWTAYITADQSSLWAQEARQRVRALYPIPPFNKVLENRYEDLARDSISARSLAQQYPQDARRWGETKILGWWADAEKAGDRATAAKHLRVARALGAELAQSRGEGMVRAAVAAIDASTGSARVDLADGHILFRDAQQASLANRIANAREKHLRAAEKLRRGGSPVALLADYFVAHTYHAMGDLPEARRRELALLAEAPSEFPAYRAQLLWHLGLGYMSDGSWGKSKNALTESISIFERLNEEEFTAIVRVLIAETHERTGDPQRAWSQQITALRQIGRSNTARLQMSLDSIARGAILRREWDIAVSFLDLADETAVQGNNPLAHIEMLLLHARAYAKMSRPQEASDAISRSRAAAATLADEAVRRDSLADIMATEAIITSSPREALNRLTKAIDYHKTFGRRIRLPDMLLSRGRAFMVIGNHERAVADFEAGIVEVENQRDSLPEGPARWGIFNAAGELFDEAIAAALSRQDKVTAFSLSERARSRELLDALASTWHAFSPLQISSDVVLVEYAFLPERLVTFVALDGTIHTVEQRISHAALDSEVKRFREALQANSSVRARLAGASLYGSLVKPIESFLAGKRTIIFVPGPVLSNVPFAALAPSHGPHLIERHIVMVTPSAAAYAQLAALKRRRASRRHLLLLANPTSPGEHPVLLAAEREAVAIASMYEHATVLRRERATSEAFRLSAAVANVIHFAVHGLVPVRTSDEAAIVLADGHMDVHYIAATPLPEVGAVVLATCDSALGTLRSEGTISVCRAFLAARVPSVIATLWPIEDSEASDFFTRLHHHLASGLDPAHALQVTQIEWIHRPDATIKLWAAVQSNGS